MWHASLMDIRQNTSFKAILKDYSISSTSKAHIHSCLRKGAWLWLVVRPFNCSSCFSHSTFISMMCFHFNLILPLTFNFITCECEHMLNASSTHHMTMSKTSCMPSFKRVGTLWKEIWYALMSRTSLWADLFMIHEDQVFVTNVVVTNSMRRLWHRV
jgi:hypothetical protein